jgi:hypothetical protein
LSALPVTIAEYCDDVPSVTVVAPLRVSVTVGGGGVGIASVTLRLRATEGLAMLVAVMVTLEYVGDFDGAV